ncbi:PREDICTED: geranylgeranyl pyrophosphate synthase-like [Priapulus caudatus]|uniref:Geranylgeranyl pyrophosphate synthase-like n=1 Tax=Priapulus caudatus TaxID=37621 RepID=A0ABM1F2G6_PRICU|nr:PREDICTED: geranylgeranyl pyrophosphate synthase-like [Priapulus caudatus]
MASCSSSHQSNDKSTPDAPVHSKEDEKILLEPYQYIQQVPGKSIRTKLAQAFNYWLNIPAGKLAIIGEVTEMLHNASLLIDDIEDNSILRRGQPVAHAIYGVASTINAANYVYFLGLEKAVSLSHPDCTKVFTDQLLELHRGQGMDIHWRDTYTCPTEEQYNAMVIRKTGGLFGLATRLMQLFSTNSRTRERDKDTHDLMCLGPAPYRVDDGEGELALSEILTYSDNKSYCEDLTEGKFSFPIIHAIRSRPEDNQIMSILISLAGLFPRKQGRGVRGR